MNKDKPIKVLILTTIMAPYRVELFEELGKKSDLTVMYEQKHDAIRNKTWYVKGHETYDTVCLKRWNKPLQYLKTEVLYHLLRIKPDKVIAYEYSTITAMFLMLCCQILRIPYGINCDGGFVQHHLIKDAIKRRFISHADFCLAGGNYAKQYLMSYGARRIQIINFTSLHDIDIVKKPVDYIEKCTLREKLGIYEDQVILSVGRIVPEKGFDILLKACSQNPMRVGVYIIGGKANEEYMQLIKDYDLKNIHFINFADKRLLTKYYMSADIFVLPTRGDVWGLVVNEAMACGLPIITTNQCVAGLELVDDEGGYIVKVDDVSELQKAMRELLDDADRRKRMQLCNLNKIRDYTIEKSADLILENINANDDKLN